MDDPNSVRHARSASMILIFPYHALKMEEPLFMKPIGSSSAEFLNGSLPRLHQLSALISNGTFV